ncbi:MAG: glutamate racemase [Ignavibacteria bacterium]|nr:glutamate racemase [Ignavibacteria bacterium]
MKEEKSKIGIFDSGVGGLSVLKQFIKYLPFESYIYLGDTARVPYGNKSSETIKKYAKECTEFLLSKNVKLIVVACHTVSSVALEEVEKVSAVPVVGMIRPATKSALIASRNKRIGVIGTRATIASNAYQDYITQNSYNSELRVFAKPCPLFVPLVEEGFINHSATKLVANEYLSDFLEMNIDTLILGCTHYPLLTKVIKEILPDVELIDAGEQAAIFSLRLLAENKLLQEEKDNFLPSPNVEFYLTDMPMNFKEIAKTFLGFEVDKIEIVNLSGK